MTLKTLRNTTRRRVGLLTQTDHPLLPFWVNSIRNKYIGLLFIISDSQKFSEKNKALLRERTSGYFETEPIASDINALSINNDDIPRYEVDNHNSEECIDLIKKLELDLLVNCGTPRKLKERVFNSVPIGTLNVHPGLLPKYRGSSAVEWSLFNGDEVGNTAHFMDDRYDGGNIIQKRVVDIQDLDSYTAVRTAVYLQNFEH